MKFVYNFYVLIVVSRSSFGAGTRVVFQAVWVAWSKADFDVEELKHLAKKLSSVECAKLLEEMYLMTDSYVEEGEHSKPRRISRRDVQVTLATESNCLIKLEEWNRKFSGTGNSNARTSMEMALKALGRPDLAKYIRKTRRVVQFLNRIVEAETESFSTVEVHRISKRHVIRSSDNTDLQKKMQWRSRKDLETRFKESPEENGQEKLTTTRKAEDMGRVEEEVVQDGEKIVGRKSRWIAFAILLVVVVVFFCVIILCALYKKKSRKSSDTRLRQEQEDEMDSENRICTVCCTPIKRSRRRRSSSSGIDVEGEKWKNKKKRKYSRIASDKYYGDKLEQQMLLDAGRIQERRQRSGDEGKVHRKSLKRREEKIGKIKKRGFDLAGSYCAKSKNISRKSQKLGKSIPRTPSHSDLKKFQEKILSLLRKECNDCKCCQCTFANEGKGKSGKVKFLEKTCTCCDPNCRTHRAKSIVDFCLSDETAYLKNIKDSKNSENSKDLKRKKKKKKREGEGEEEEIERSCSRCSSLSRRKKEKRVKGEHMVPCDGKICARSKFSKSPRLGKDRIEMCVNTGTKQKQKKFF